PDRGDPGRHRFLVAVSRLAGSAARRRPMKRTNTAVLLVEDSDQLETGTQGLEVLPQGRDEDVLGVLELRDGSAAADQFATLVAASR
ncbi:MAG TPA: hypothetical protein VM287_16250, partial [Egibacteraceae bacterium]|nr:hypothetical protein [Egibacteraceae bacterium]